MLLPKSLELSLIYLEQLLSYPDVHLRRLMSRSDQTDVNPKFRNPLVVLHQLLVFKLARLA